MFYWNCKKLPLGNGIRKRLFLSYPKDPLEIAPGIYSKVSTGNHFFFLLRFPQKLLIRFLQGFFLKFRRVSLGGVFFLSSAAVHAGPCFCSWISHTVSAGFPPE